MREYLGKSLNALKADKVELFYLHAPDRSTPFEVTFRAVDELHKEGKFDKVRAGTLMLWLGLTLFVSWVYQTTWRAYDLAFPVRLILGTSH